MIKTYAFYIGFLLLWVFGLILVGEIAETIRQNTDRLSADQETVAGATVFLYVGASLFIYGVM